MTPPSHHKTIYRHVCQQWSAQVKVTGMEAPDTPLKQDIIVIADWPAPGLTAYSTIGLSDYGGSELACVVASKNKSVTKIIFDVAALAFASGHPLESGGAYEKLVARYYTRAETGHLLLSGNAPGGLRISSLAIDERTVSWLYGWPITSDELIHHQNGGGDAVETALRELDIEVAADLQRATADGVPEFNPWG